MASENGQIRWDRKRERENEGESKVVSCSPSFFVWFALPCLSPSFPWCRFLIWASERVVLEAAASVLALLVVSLTRPVDGSVLLNCAVCMAQLFCTHTNRPKHTNTLPWHVHSMAYCLLPPGDNKLPSQDRVAIAFIRNWKALTKR